MSANIFQPMPPIWVVSLLRSEQRRQFMRNQLNRWHLTFDFIDAVDGSRLSPYEINQNYDPIAARARLGRDLSPGEIGCALTHLRAYWRMIEEKLDEVLILEDDAVLHPDFEHIVQNRGHFPGDWDAVLFYHGGRTRKHGHWPIGYAQYRTVRFGGEPWGSVAYLIRRSGAERLLSAAHVISRPSDVLICDTDLTGIVLYGIEPPCVSELVLEQPEQRAIQDREYFRIRSAGSRVTNRMVRVFNRVLLTARRKTAPDGRSKPITDR